MEIKGSESISSSDNEFFTARIAVCGIGGGGDNTISRLNKMGLKDANLIAINTDSKHLSGMSQDIQRILIGTELTRGLGAGGYASIGNKAAELSRREIEKALNNYNLVFITAGIG